MEYESGILHIDAEISKVEEEITHLYVMSSSLELDRSSSLASSEWEQLSAIGYSPSKAAKEDVQHQQNYLHSIWLPTETWADVFKFLSRRTLLKRVQPTCRHFHAIAESKVDNVHLIRNFGYFLGGLARDLPMANEQMEDLVANDASLSKHFRLDESVTFCVQRQAGCDMDRAEHRYLAQKCVLLHSLDLFHRCRLQIILQNNSIENSGVYLEYLALLQPIKPYYIKLSRWDNEALELDELLRVPIILNCPWLTFYQDRYTPSIANSICKWLHHLPIWHDEKEQDDRTRIFNLRNIIMSNAYTDVIIECCKKLLKQTEFPADSRAFLFIFHSSIQLMPFQIEHPPTGEVLQLKSFHHSKWSTYNYYHLRRCPIADLATTDQFNRDTFDPEGFLVYSFREPIKNGLLVPHLQIK